MMHGHLNNSEAHVAQLISYKPRHMIHPTKTKATRSNPCAICLQNRQLCPLPIQACRSEKPAPLFALHATQRSTEILQTSTPRGSPRCPVKTQHHLKPLPKIKAFSACKPCVPASYAPHPPLANCSMRPHTTCPTLHTTKPCALQNCFTVPLAALHVSRALKQSPTSANLTTKPHVISQSSVNRSLHSAFASHELYSMNL